MVDINGYGPKARALLANQEIVSKFSGQGRLVFSISEIDKEYRISIGELREFNPYQGVSVGNKYMPLGAKPYSPIPDGKSLDDIINLELEHLDEFVPFFDVIKNGVIYKLAKTPCKILNGKITIIAAST